MISEIEIEKECKCECGDTAILETVYVHSTDKLKGITKIGVQYWCYHRCDSLFSKIIEIKIK